MSYPPRAELAAPSHAHNGSGPVVWVAIIAVTWTEYARVVRSTALVLRETSAFGVRRHIAERRKLRREFTTVKTVYGEVQVKLGRLDGKVVQASPEHESCKRLAEQANVPLKAVYEAAVRASAS